jgi:hypothetical protein
MIEQEFEFEHPRYGVVAVIPVSATVHTSTDRGCGVTPPSLTVEEVEMHDTPQWVLAQIREQWECALIEGGLDIVPCDVTISECADWLQCVAERIEQSYEECE